MSIDIHTHAFHPKMAHKAVGHLNDYYHVDCAGDGTITDLKQWERRTGIARFVMLCTE